MDKSPSLVKSVSGGPIAFTIGLEKQFQFQLGFSLQEDFHLSLLAA